MGRRKNKNTPQTANIVNRFQEYIGKAELPDWQRLCQDIGLFGDLSSITKCRKALKKVYVNIVDLLEAVAKGEQPQRFRNTWELADYSVRTKRIYPRNKAKQGPIKALLREIL